MIFVAFGSTEAQVTIGSEVAPGTGALLDLKMGADGKSTKGLGLPKVALVSLTSLQPCLTAEEEAVAGAKAAHEGLQVYNTTETGELKRGVYVWYGSVWRRASQYFNAATSTRLRDDEVKIENVPVDVTFARLNIAYAGTYMLVFKGIAGWLGTGGRQILVQLLKDDAVFYATTVTPSANSIGDFFTLVNFKYMDAGIYDVRFFSVNPVNIMLRLNWGSVDAVRMAE
ncbi:hypothetical protein D0T49_08135 [Paludibacter sp. 221]|nr:hypothetical protein [Paludibacter sp. 221]